jgi:hypothetical protein
MQCLGSKQKKIPLIEIRSVVLPAYANTICKTNEGIKYGDYSRVLSSRKARELFKNNYSAIQFGNATFSTTHGSFPYLEQYDAKNCLLYINSPCKCLYNTIIYNGYYVTLDRFKTALILSYNDLQNLFGLTDEQLIIIKSELQGTLNPTNIYIRGTISCSKLINASPLVIK